MKTCTQCRETKPLEAFSPNKTGPDGHHTWCRSCKAASARAWQVRNQEKKREYDRAFYLKHGEGARAQARKWHRDNHARSLENKRRWKLARHGLTDAQRADIYNAQGGRCAICAEPRESSHLNVDHDHEAGHIRGLLCHFCNVGLGHFSDRPERLRAAANYLERTATRKTA